MRKFSASVLFSVVIAGVAGCSSDPVGPPQEIKLALAPAASGDGQAGEVGQELALNLSVLVTRNGLPAQGIEVQWAAAPGNGAVAPAVAVSNAEGIAAGSWILPTTSGPMTATASVTNAVGTPVTFHATAEAGPPTTLTQTGSNQSVTVGLKAGEPLTVRLRDQFGNPVPSIHVVWSVISGTVTLSAQVVDTDETGGSSVEVTAGMTPGAVVIQATPEAAVPLANFHLTVVP